jgi:zinc protease
MKFRSSNLFITLILCLLLLPVVCRGDVVDLSGIHFLENGLDVRLMPEPSTPVVATLALIRTGYAAEGNATSGFSHLLEHLVFAGTLSRTREEIQQEVKSLGGYVNGFTRDDYTGYLIVGHRDHLQKHLDILSDMLFNSTIREQAVDEAREVVLEEIRRMQSRPETREDTLFESLLYEGSPYARTALGNETTVSSVTRDDIDSFYRLMYRPNNMVLLIKGGIDEGGALEAVRESFGRVSMGPDAARPSPPPPLMSRRSYILGSSLPDVRVRVGFAGPDPKSGDVEAVELLLGILGGTDGVLDRALKGAGLKPRSVWANLYVNAGFSRIVLSAVLPEDSDPTGVRNILLEAIPAALDSRQFSRWMAETRESMAAEEIMGREKLHYHLMGISPWVIAASPGQGMSPGRWDDLGADDLAKAARKYMIEKPFIALLTVPEDKRGGGTIEDRDSLRMKTRLGNGLEVVAEQRPGSPVFAMHVMTRHRSAMEPEGKEGIADFLHRLLPLGTYDSGREELESQLRTLGVSLSTAGSPMSPFGDFYTSRLYSWIRLECLEDQAERAAALLAEMVKTPLLSPDAVEEVRGQMLGFVAYNAASPGKVASRLLAGTVYGETLRPDVYGSEKSISGITRRDLQRFHGGYFTGNNLIISVVSGMPPEQAVTLVKKLLSDLPAGPSSFYPQPMFLTRESSVSETRLEKSQGAYAAGAVTDYVEKETGPAFDIASGILNTRFMEELREKEGLAYSLGASLGEVHGTAVFSFTMGTAPDKIERARQALREQIAEAKRRCVTAEELEREVNGLVGRLQMRMLSSINRAFYIGLAARENFPHTFGEDYREILLKLRSGELEEVLERYLPAEELVEVLVR